MSDKKTFYLNGLKQFGASQHKYAIASFRQALELDPEWTDCLQALSMALMNAGELDEALETAKKNCELATTDPLAYTSLSMIYQRLDRIDDAETAQNKARLLSWKQELKENPDAPPPTGMNVMQ